MTFTMLGDECVLYCRLVFGRNGTERRQFRPLLSRGFLTNPSPLSHTCRKRWLWQVELLWVHSPSSKRSYLGSLG